MKGLRSPTVRIILVTALAAIAQVAGAELIELDPSNFDDVVFSEGVVFVDFYAPWCGHCKRLEPIWEELAQEYAGLNDLVIAKMDATANEVENFKVGGYPTIKLYSKENKKGIDYEGEREIN